MSRATLHAVVLPVSLARMDYFAILESIRIVTRTVALPTVKASAVRFWKANCVVVSRDFSVQMDRNAWTKRATVVRQIVEEPTVVVSVLLCRVSTVILRTVSHNWRFGKD
jgi:hypothetical protein